jgi:Na+/proline symporter
VAALFWRSSTKWGALASTIWVALSVLAIAVLQNAVPAPAGGRSVVVLSLAGVEVITRGTSGALVFGFLPVVPMTIVSAALMIGVSWLTPASRPDRTTLDRYFPADGGSPRLPSLA